MRERQAMGVLDELKVSEAVGEVVGEGEPVLNREGEAVSVAETLKVLGAVVAPGVVEEVVRAVVVTSTVVEARGDTL